MGSKEERVLAETMQSAAEIHVDEEEQEERFEDAVGEDMASIVTQEQSVAVSLLNPGEVLAQIVLFAA